MRRSVRRQGTRGSSVSRCRAGDRRAESWGEHRVHEIPKRACGRFAQRRPPRPNRNRADASDKRRDPQELRTTSMRSLFLNLLLILLGTAKLPLSERRMRANSRDFGGFPRSPSHDPQPAGRPSRNGSHRCAARYRSREPEWRRRRRRSRPTCRRWRPAARPTAACRRAGRRPPPGPVASGRRASSAGAPGRRRDARRRGRRDRRVPSARRGVDDDFDQVVVQQLADRAAGERFGPDVTDAGAGRDAGEPGVGHQRHLLAPRQVLAAPR